MTGSIRGLRGNKMIMKTLQMMVGHIISHSNEIVFMKCEDPTCSLKCTVKENKAKELTSFLKLKGWFNPQQSPTHNGHYMTFLEQVLIDKEHMIYGMFNSNQFHFNISLFTRSCVIRNTF